MKLDLNEKTNKSISTKVVKVIGPLVVIALVIVVALNIKTVGAKLFNTKTEAIQKVATVKKGNMQLSIKGSGAIYFTKDNNITSKVGGTVTAVNFKAGDMVKAGDVIYKVDDTNAQNAMEVAQNGLAQSQVAANSSNEAVANLTINAPFTGQVSNILVKAGDNVAAGANLLTITDTSKLKVLLTFNSADASKIAIGQSATIYITYLMDSVQGKVTYISNDPTTTSSGGKLFTVEVDLNNPGGVLGGMTANGDIKTSNGTVSSTSAAALDYVNKLSVITKTGGTVQSIAVKENQKVNSNDLLVQMKDDDILRAQQAANLKVQVAQDGINADTTQLGYYTITSPIDGTLSTVAFQVGDNVSAGAQMAQVSNLGAMKFDIPIDEMDIAKVQVGQKANINVDSVASTLTHPLQGEVESISDKGTTVSGVTTYLVTIKVDGSSDILKGGMTANAQVLVDNKPDVLYVPIGAISNVNGKNYVMVKEKKGSSIVNSGSDDISTQSSGYYAGSVRKEVKIGVSDGTSIEITSGLKEGDKVILPIL